MERHVGKYKRESKKTLKRNHNKQISNVLRKYSSKEKLVSEKVKTAVCLDQTEKNYIFTKATKSETEQNIGFANLSPSKIHTQINHSSTSYAVQSELSYSKIRRQFQRYTDILCEVKKILKKDSISKRNLKYIVRNQHINFPIPNVKLRPSSEDEPCTPENICKEDEDDQEVDFNHLKCLQRRLAAKAKASLNKQYLSAETSTSKAVTNTDKKSVFLTKNLLSAKKTTKSKIEYTNSIFPSATEEEILNRSITKTAEEVTLIHEISLSNKVSNKDSYQNCKYNYNYKNYVEHQNKFLSGSKNLQQPTNLVANSSLNKKSTDFIYSSKSNIKLKEILSFYELSSNSQSKSQQSSLSSLKLASNFTHGSPLFWIRKNNSNILLNQNTTLLNTISSDLNNCGKNFYNNCRSRSRSASCTISSRSLSLSNSMSSEENKKQISSRDSASTIFSSRKGSKKCCSSSRSLSTRSSKTSRSDSTFSSRTRSPSIPRRHGSPSFLHRRRITSARKRPVPYHRPTPSPLASTCSAENSNYLSDQSYKSSSTFNSQQYMDI